MYFCCVSCCVISFCTSLVVKRSGLSDAIFSVFAPALVFIVVFAFCCMFSVHLCVLSFVIVFSELVLFYWALRCFVVLFFSGRTVSRLGVSCVRYFV